MAFAALGTAAAQQQGFATYSDSTTFVDRTTRPVETDFEDIWSVTIQGVTIRNPYSLLVGRSVDAAGQEGHYVAVADQGVIEFPARTRGVTITSHDEQGEDGYSGPILVTDFNDETTVLDPAIAPITITRPNGVKRLRFLDPDGGINVTWKLPISSIITTDGAGRKMLEIDFHDLEPYRTYLLSRAYSHPVDTLPYPGWIDAITTGDMTFSDKSSLRIDYSFDGEGARIDPDNGLGNNGLSLSPGGAIVFPEGTEGAMLVLEPFYCDTVTVSVVDGEGGVHILGALGDGSGTVYLGFSSPLGIARASVLDVGYGRVTVGSVLLARTPLRELNGISGVVEQLDTHRFLTGDQSTLLHSTLTDAGAAISERDNTRAISRLRAFIGDVDALYNQKVIVFEERNTLVNDGEHLMQRLQTPSGVVTDAGTSTTVKLGPAYPSPARSEAWLPYSTDAAGAFIRIDDLRGVPVCTLALEASTTSATAAYWDCRDASGRLVPDGIYFYTLHAGDATRTGKLIVSH
jgi:hypothetical protein